MRTQVLAVADKYGTELYGATNEKADEIGTEMRTILRGMGEADCLVLDLARVDYLDTGFTNRAYRSLLGGKVTPKSHRAFCMMRRGSGLVFLDAIPHRDNLAAAVDRARDVLVYADQDLALRAEGAALSDVLSGCYGLVRSRGGRGTTSQDILDYLETLAKRGGRGATLPNAANVLGKLHGWGLVYRTAESTEGGGRTYHYRPIDLDRGALEREGYLAQTA